MRPLNLQVASPDRSPLPLSLSEIKQHCAVDGTDFDDLLTRYLFAAILWAEGQIHRSIVARQHIWTLSDFPRQANRLCLPRGKLQSVSSVVYYDTVSTTVTIAGSPAGFQIDLGGDDGGAIMPLNGDSWPSVDYDAVAPVQVTFTAGWLSDEIPDDVIHAIYFTISDFFEARGAETSEGRNYDTRFAMISPYRLDRFYP